MSFLVVIATTLAFRLATSLPRAIFNTASRRANSSVLSCSAAVNNQTSEGVAIKKVTNVFSKKILAKRALREIKLLEHFRGHRNVRRQPTTFPAIPLDTNQRAQITCLYDMDIPRPNDYNETYLYEGTKV